MFPFEKSHLQSSRNETLQAPPIAFRDAIATYILRTMGNLAERYRDAARSGVYAVRDAGIPRAAAMEAEVLLIEVPATGLPAQWARFEQAIAAEAGRPCVLLVPDAAALARPEFQGTLERLAAAALARREAARPLFAVLVDPEGLLGLPPLYREKPER